MGSAYEKLLSETHDKIKDIRREAQEQITNVRILALRQVERDFVMLGWSKYWTRDKFIAEGQFERLEQSISDTNLILANLDENSKTATIEDSVSVCRVSGKACTCADFVYRGLPCKHIYFLAGTLMELQEQNKEEKS